jgi:hypothetical protein
MTRTKPGDLVFSYANAEIRDVGVISSEAVETPKPYEFGTAGNDWSAIGWLVTADFVATPKSLKPKGQITDIKPMLATKYAPLNSGAADVWCYSCKQLVTDIRMAKEDESNSGRSYASWTDIWRCPAGHTLYESKNEMRIIYINRSFD